MCYRNQRHLAAHRSAGFEEPSGLRSDYKRRRRSRLDCVAQIRGYKISSRERKRAISRASEEKHCSVGQILWNTRKCRTRRPWIDRLIIRRLSHRDVLVAVSQVLPFRVIKNGSSWWLRQHSLVTKHGNSVESGSLKDCSRLQIAWRLISNGPFRCYMAVLSF